VVVRQSGTRRNPGAFLLLLRADARMFFQSNIPVIRGGQQFAVATRISTPTAVAGRLRTGVTFNSSLGRRGAALSRLRRRALMEGL
jgi:hypothetical protein